MMISFLNSSKKLFYCGSLATLCVIVVVAVLFTLFSSVSSKSSETQLDFVIVVTRHGSRSPLLFYPTDPYNDSTYWPQGMNGELTNKGKQEMYQVGKNLRKRYYNLLNGRYEAKDIYIRSTHTPRSFMSTGLLLAGMFPPEGDDVWNAGLLWQPIPIWIDDLEFDKTKISTNRSLCPKFSEDQAQIYEDSKAFLAEKKDLMNYITKNSGRNIETIRDYLALWDTVSCEIFQGLPLPAWVNSIYPEPMTSTSLKMYDMSVVGTRRMNRLLSGTLMNDFSSWITRKTSGAVSEKMLLHSGHDFTLLGLFKALGFKGIGRILPSAFLMFEFYNLSGSRYMKVYYANDSSIEEPVQLNIPNCNDPCPQESFLKIIGDMETTKAEWEVEFRDNSKANKVCLFFIFIMITFLNSSVELFCILIGISYMLALLVVFPNLFVSTSSEPTGSELEFVIIVTRHGSRSPTIFYPTDPYSDSSYWPLGLHGQLTNHGKQQMFQLGKNLRKRYYNLFDGRYNTEDIYIRSTHVTRTAQSAELMLAGMFPPEGNQIWNEDLLWQPIPVWIDDFEFDKMKIADNDTLCPKFSQIRTQLIPDVEKYLMEKKDLIDYISKNSGVEMNYRHDFFKVFDPVSCEAALSLSLPAWLKPIYPEPMMSLAAHLGRITIVGTPQMNRLLSGPLIKDFNSWITRKVNGAVSEKMLIHSAHDITIFGLLNALGFEQNTMPLPSALLALELYNISGSRYVKLFYANESSQEEPVQLNIPKCEDPCLLDTFLQITGEMAIDGDWKEECIL